MEYWKEKPCIKMIPNAIICVCILTRRTAVIHNVCVCVCAHLPKVLGFPAYFTYVCVCKENSEIVVCLLIFY